MIQDSTHFSKLNYYSVSPNNHVARDKFEYLEKSDEVWTKVNCYEDMEKRMKHEVLDKSNFEFTPYQAIQYYQKSKRYFSLKMSNEDVNLE